MEKISKPTWKHWIGTDGEFGGKYYHFNTFKVYWAYRWYQAREVDRYCAKTPIKTIFGYKIDITNYEETYK